MDEVHCMIDHYIYYTVLNIENKEIVERNDFRIIPVTQTVFYSLVVVDIVDGREIRNWTRIMTYVMLERSSVMNTVFYL